MAIFAYTLDQLVEKTCKLLLHDWVEGTATGGSSTTVVDTSRYEDDDYFNSKNSFIYIRTGTYAGAYRRITDFVQSATPTITFSPAVGGSIVATDTYSIHTNFSRDEVVEAINTAIDMVAEEAMVWVIDESTVTLAADTYEYDLPTSLMYLHRVTMADADGYFYDAPIPPDQYKIIYGTTPKIHFIQMPTDQQFEGHYYGQLWANSDFTADRVLRLEGLGSPATLSTDSSTSPLSPAYIIYQAAALLHESRIVRPETDPDEHRVQAQLCQTRADIERQKVVNIQLPPNSKRIRE
jgi:hypothetical protein